MAEGGARGETERIEPTKAERAQARRVAESKATIPHLYAQGELTVDGGSGLLATVVSATAKALRQAPRLNGAYRDGGYETYSRVNIGVVAAEADGLVVPTIFDADEKGVDVIATELDGLFAKAADGTITARELAGGTFTVATGYGYEGCAYMPVINAGQAANLGIGSPAGGAVVATVAADARMISGAEASSLLALIQMNLVERREPE